MTWADQVREQLAKDEIPGFLGATQELVAALREGREWEHLLTPTIRDHAELVLAYLDEGAKKEQVKAALAGE